MAQWRVELSEKAESDIKAIDRPVRKRIMEALEWLSDNFDSVVPIPLEGYWKRFFKLRVGDWRAIYDIDVADRVLTVHLIDRRDKIYKRKI